MCMPLHYIRRLVKELDEGKLVSSSADIPFIYQGRCCYRLIYTPANPEFITLLRDDVFEIASPLHLAPVAANVNLTNMHVLGAKLVVQSSSVCGFADVFLANRPTRIKALLRSALESVDSATVVFRYLMSCSAEDRLGDDLAVYKTGNGLIDFISLN